MGDYNQLLTEHLRLAILQLLEQADGYDLNADIISSALSKIGHQPSRDKLEADLNWLAEQGLATLTKVGSLTVAKLTQRGADVAAGRAMIPGITRPLP